MLSLLSLISRNTSIWFVNSTTAAITVEIACASPAAPALGRHPERHHDGHDQKADADDPRPNLSQQGHRDAERNHAAQQHQADGEQPLERAVSYTHLTL